jgi:hypothetical protein
MTRLAILLSTALVVSCGSDSVDPISNEGDVVGGPCTDFMDCAPDSYCETDSDFPDGICTLDCRDDRDCPEGSVCIDKQGGICLLLCNFDSDCRRQYECEDENRRGASGKATVCIKD